MLVTAASAFGIQLFGFNLFEWRNHTEVTRNEEIEMEGEKRFYEPGYVPEGYELINTDAFFDISIDKVYENEEGNLLYIEQCEADSFSSNFNNEDCIKDSITINGIETLIYRYNDGSIQYVMNLNGTVIVISGMINDMDCRKIISGLK